MRTDVLWITLFVLAASTTVSALVPRTVGYVVVLGVYLLFVAWLLVTDRFAVVYHWAVLPLVVLIWVVFTLTTALEPTIAGIIRLGAFTVITGINLFVVPAVIDRSALHDAIAYTAGAFVLIGLPTVFVGSYGVAGVMISPWHTDFSQLGIVLNTPVSVFDNPNYLSSVAAIGAVAAGAQFARSRSPLAAGLIGVSALGVVLAGGRAALLALAIAGGLYAVYRTAGRTATAVLVGLGAFGVVVGFAMAFRLIPGPSAVANVDLSGRRAIWTAAHEAVASRPVLGWGPGNDTAVLAKYMGSSVYATHNSYIRMFLISGTLGGLAYLTMTASVVVTGLRNMRSEAVFTFLLLVMFLVMQLFSGMTIFGLSLPSTLGAVFVGYGQSIGSNGKATFSVRQWLPDSIRSIVIR